MQVTCHCLPHPRDPIAALRPKLLENKTILSPKLSSARRSLSIMMLLILRHRKHHEDKACSHDVLYRILALTFRPRSTAHQDGREYRDSINLSQPPHNIASTTKIRQYVRHASP